MSIRRDEINLILTINDKSAGTTIKDLQKQAADLRRLLQRLPIDSEEFKKTKTELDAINAKLAEATGKAKAVDRAMEGVGTTTGRLPAIFGKINTALNAAGILGLINLIVTASQKIFKIGQDSLKLYDQGAKADAQLKAALKSTNEAAGRSFEQLEQQAKALQETTLFDDEATKSAQGLLLTFTNIRGEIFDETIPVIQDLATAMATATGETVDLKSASIQVGKALNDPVKGISALTRVGVSFSAQQKETIAQMVEMGNVAGAQKIILEELNREFGGSAQAAAQAGAGGWQQLQNKIGDLQEAFGELINRGLKALQPVFEGVVEFISKFVGSILSGEKATGRFSTTVNISVGILKGLHTIFTTIVGTVMGFGNVLSSLPDIARNALLNVTGTAALAAKRIELAFTFDDAAENKLKGEIARLENLQGQSKTTGELLGAAFREGYNKKLLGDTAAASVAGATPGDAPAIDPAAAREEIQKRVKAAQDAKMSALQAGFERENLLIEGQLLKQETTEREAAQRRLANEQAFFEQKMALMRQFGQEETNEFLRLQNQLSALRIKAEQDEMLRREQASIQTISTLALKTIETEKIAEDQRLNIQAISQQLNEKNQKAHLERKAQNEKDYQDAVKFIEESTAKVKEEFFQVAIDLLGKDAEARKKNGTAIKAFQTAKVLVDLQTELSGIFAGTAGFGPAGWALAAVRAAIATARSAVAIRSIAATKFATGGFTGPGMGAPDNTGFKPAGIVHAGEWVAPAWMVQQHGQQISALERIRQKGYATGGFVNTTPTAAAPAPAAGEQQALIEARMMRAEFSALRNDLTAWQRNLKVSVAYTDIEDVADTLSTIRADAAL